MADGSRLSISRLSPGLVAGLSVVAASFSILLVFRQPVGADIGFAVMVNAPRIVSGFAAGALLGLAGAVWSTMQVRPARELQVFGLSAGAASGGAALSHLGLAGLVGGALMGGGLAVSIALLLARPASGRLSNIGVALFLLAMLGLLVRTSFHVELSPYRDVLRWAMGDLSRAQPVTAVLLGVTAIAGCGLGLFWASGSAEKLDRRLPVLAPVAWGVAVGAVGPLAFVPLFAALASRAVVSTGGLASHLLASSAAGAAIVPLGDALPRFAVGGYAPAWNVGMGLVAIPLFLWWNRRRLRAVRGDRGPLVLEGLEAAVILALAVGFAVGSAGIMGFLRTAS